ncbi:hypothetical protein C0J52_15041 [Blattella germanica]|nr:hypothetical protein C0J52_15041 [Blattella germanica]
MKFISTIFGSRGSIKLCRPIPPTVQELRQSYVQFPDSTNIKVYEQSHDDVLKISPPYLEGTPTNIAKTSSHEIPKKSTSSAISQESTDPRNSEDKKSLLVPNKRKDEVSSEVPKIGVSAEPHNASDIRTPIFEKSEQ